MFHTQFLVRQLFQCHWRRRRKFLILLALIALLIPSSFALRCYTDILATKSQSVECGLNSGCVKIYIDSEELLLRRNLQYGYDPAEGGEAPSLPERYMNNPVLLRGCFVLAVPDRCYSANNGLTYCWCSTKDLCNDSIVHRPNSLFIGLTVVMSTLFNLKSFLISANLS